MKVADTEVMNKIVGIIRDQCQGLLSGAISFTLSESLIKNVCVLFGCVCVCVYVCVRCVFVCYFLSCLPPLTVDQELVITQHFRY